MKFGRAYVDRDGDIAHADGPELGRRRVGSENIESDFDVFLAADFSKFLCGCRGSGDRLKLSRLPSMGIMSMTGKVFSNALQLLTENFRPKTT